MSGSSGSIKFTGGQITDNMCASPILLLPWPHRSVLSCWCLLRCRAVKGAGVFFLAPEFQAGFRGDKLVLARNVAVASSSEDPQSRSAQERRGGGIWASNVRVALTDSRIEDNDADLGGVCDKPIKCCLVS